MATPEEEHKVAVKLLVHKEQNKVIFAEATNDFADILFSFLTLPLGTIIRLVGEEQYEPALKVGSLTNLYRSVADLDPKFFSGEICKTMLLCPRNYAELECQRLKVNIDDAKKLEFFGDPCCYRISIRKGIYCDCLIRSVMNKSVASYGSRYKEAFFTDVTTLIIGDDFSIIPSSPGIILDLCNRFGNIDMKLLTERVVHVGKKEILNLLKCSLISKTPLTDAFLRTGHPTQYQPGSIIPPQIEHTTNNSQQFTLKLLVRKADKKILFAEANGDFVNQIFSILAIPLGLVIGLLGSNSALGSVDQLYTSIMDKDIRKYLVSRDSPESNKLMHPKLVPHFSSNNQLLPLPTGHLRDVSIKYNRYVGTLWCSEINPRFHDGDCVKSLAAFIVTDDLVVKPISSLISLEFLESLEIPNKDIEEKVVSFGTDQAYKLLKSSLLSESALTEALTVDILKSPNQEK